MSQQIYVIKAFSRKLNQTQRIMDQDSLQGRHTTSQVLAEQKANAFAGELNRIQKLNTTDWVGKIELITVMG
jgi:hypothetical protein